MKERRKREGKEGRKEGKKEKRREGRKEKRREGEGRNEGKKEKRREGRKEGKEKGRKEKRREGRKEERKKIMVCRSAMGVDPGARSHCRSQTGRCHRGAPGTPMGHLGLQVAWVDATPHTFLVPEFCCY